METVKLESGKVDPEHFLGLLGFTGIVGESIIAALRAHLVDGRRMADAVREFNVSRALLSRKVSDLNKVHNAIRRVASFYH
ncbi:PapB/FocB family fimbrial expression transcriptional regulator [Pseudomonas juntendi]|uniref:PapB/FocB family fimbrial expression transcriptional regulator n=1 Tax=Pseudomonas juntendi TaxID=2666183 RepID=UPI003B9297BA